MTALTAKHKLGMVTDAYPKPSETSKYLPYWERCSSMVVSWLLNVVSKEIVPSIVYFTCAKDIWTDLVTRYSQNDKQILF